MADAAANATFNASFDVVGLHYPCTSHHPEVAAGGKAFWAVRMEGGRRREAHRRALPLTHSPTRGPGPAPAERGLVAAARLARRADVGPPAHPQLRREQHDGNGRVVAALVRLRGAPVRAGASCCCRAGEPPSPPLPRAAAAGRCIRVSPTSRHDATSGGRNCAGNTPLRSPPPLPLPRVQAGLMLADEPWSGHYDLSPPLWTGAQVRTHAPLASSSSPPPSSNPTYQRAGHAVHCAGLALPVRAWGRLGPAAGVSRRDGRPLLRAPATSLCFPASLQRRRLRDTCAA